MSLRESLSWDKEGEERQGAEEAEDLGDMAARPCVRERAKANCSQPQKAQLETDL